METLFSWTTLGITVAVLVPILVGYLLFGRIRFTFRFRGAVSVAPWAEKPCPHLGLIDEPFIHREEPNEEHRCYLWMQRDRIDLTHQKGFCLSSAHAHCPWLSVAPPAGEGPSSRRLATGVAAAATPVFGFASKAAARSTFWLLTKLDKAMETTRQGAGVALPSIAVFAIAAAKLSARGAVVAAKAIWRATVIVTPKALHLLNLAWKRVTGPKAAEQVASTALPQPDQAVAQAAQPAAEAMATPALAPEYTLQIPQAAPERTASGHVESLIEQGKAASSDGDRKLAYTLFSLALDLEPKNDEVWLWKGASAEGDEEKITCFQQALAINPNSLRAQQALKQLTQESWASQTKIVGQAVEPAHYSGHSADALMEAAVFALEKGDEDGAYRYAVSATEINPRSEKAWFWRAKTAGSLDEVIYSLNQALAINPGNEKVRANLLWAIQRQQREEKVRQPQTAAPAQVVRKKDEGALKRNLIAAGSRWLASMVCLVLAGYWVAAALQPLFAILELGKAVEEVLSVGLGSGPTNALSEVLGRWLPDLTWSSLPWHQELALTSGYSLLAAVPYTVGFLYLFIGIGILRQERWTLFWGLAATVCSLALGILFTRNADSTVLVIALGLVAALALVMGRTERRKEISPELVQHRSLESHYRPAR